VSSAHKTNHPKRLQFLQKLAPLFKTGLKAGIFEQMGLAYKTRNKQSLENETNSDAKV